MMQEDTDFYSCMQMSLFKILGSSSFTVIQRAINNSMRLHKTLIILFLSFRLKKVFLMPF